MDILDWGNVTPEGGSISENRFYYIINHDISSEEKVNRTIRFIIGRLNYYDKHLPTNAFHELKIDVRGQHIADGALNIISENLKALYLRPQFINVVFIK